MKNCINQGINPFNYGLEIDDVILLLQIKGSELVSE
jgi:hypothetical protein